MTTQTTMKGATTMNDELMQIGALCKQLGKQIDGLKEMEEKMVCNEKIECMRSIRNIMDMLKSRLAEW